MNKLVALMLIATVGGAADQAEFTKDNQLVRPDNYREWIFLSSGLGMTYGPNAPAAGSNLRFDNVYVNPSSYRQFLKSGTWPDGTILILEVRESQSKGSINQHGHYQTSLVGLEANVKDSRRFPNNRWAFFNLGASGPRTVKAIAPGNGCQKCHDQNGAVDSTFVQFYPDLVPVAKKFGTFKPAPVSGGR
jgi:Cytochrome P460